jgi:hypothetical protein
MVTRLEKLGWTCQCDLELAGFGGRGTSWQISGPGLLVDFGVVIGIAFVLVGVGWVSRKAVDLRALAGHRSKKGVDLRSWAGITGI